MHTLLCVKSSVAHQSSYLDPALGLYIMAAILLNPLPIWAGSSHLSFLLTAPHLSLQFLSVFRLPRSK